MKIAIIGCGNMGGAFAKSLSMQHQISLYDRNYEKTNHLANAGFGTAFENLTQAVDSKDIIILAVKPSNLGEVSKSLTGIVKDTQIIFSILAGTSISTLRQHFPNSRIFRLMPNLAIQYGQGVIGIATECSIEEKEKYNELLQHLGKIYWISESKIDAVSSLAGSGPAFVFALLEAMIDSGIAMGLNVKDSKELSYQMIKGSLALLENSGKEPEELKWQITSPGGTTIAGLKKFEEAAIRAGIMNTFLGTYERTKELNTKS